MAKVTLVLLLALLATACSGNPNAKKPAAENGLSQRSAGAIAPADDGRDLFLANCAGCHGRNADADTPVGRAWLVPSLRSPQVQSLSDRQLMEVIRGGKGKMPAWDGAFSQVDLQHLLAYLRSLNPSAESRVH